MATATKDMWVANLVETWRGDSNSVPVVDFFESIDEAAEMGRLTAKDKVHLAKLKLKGAARLFYTAQPELRADDVTYAALKTAFINRFSDKHTDHYNYNRVQTASQDKSESPEMFLDRLRKLCQRTVQRSENAVEQAVINREADRRLLAAFINGLIGTPGRHVRMQMPDNVDKALIMAIVATNAEREDKALRREDRGESAKVFTVGGNRDMTHENEYENRYRNPRNNGKFQGSEYRGAGFQYRTGSTRNSRVDGTYSGWKHSDSRTSWRASGNDPRGVVSARSGCRSDSRTSWRASCNEPRGVVSARSGSKDDDDRRAHEGSRGIRCFNCGLEGHIQRDCRRGQGKSNLNGIGRTKATPSSNPN